ncbi:glycosyltransferase [Candidatus Daviesbacteria bacterium]|nr:glycosyltransferase [Candidatus Daviesbacteria bacterium]
MNLQKGLLKVDCPSKSIDDYKKFVPEVVEKIKSLAKSLKGLKISHLNATSVGGGVAEMLRSEVAIQKDIGLDSAWYVIPPNFKFFEITKKIHNFLQGKKGDLSKKEKTIYLEYNKLIAQFVSKLSSKPDILLVHDPQPAASASFLNAGKLPYLLWRCHIDTSTPNKNVWQFLAKYLKYYDHFVYTLPEYVKDASIAKNKVSFITPVIDPLSPKNMPMGKAQAKAYIHKFGIDTTKSLVTQVSRLDPWKDPLGVIDAYRLAKKEIPDLQLALIAQSANDDPEGEVLINKVKDCINGESGIFLLVNLPDNDQAINAFQTASNIVLQKSTREGFGLTVTEAMWKGAVVIGGNVGGIKLQIQDHVNGFLINTTPDAAERIIYVHKNPQIAEKISKKAHLSVKENFLLPHAILSYLKLFAALNSNDHKRFLRLKFGK